MHIVQLANFWTPTSGGLRTVLHHLGAQYVERGHRVTRIVPGATPGVGRPGTDDTGVTTITIGAPVLPASGGYRILRDRRALTALLRDLRPDAIELSDKTTMVGPAAAERAHGARVVLLSHERIDAILQPRPISGWIRRERLARFADRHNRSLVDRLDAVVAASEFAGAEFVRIGAPVVHRVPFGVDLQTFRPVVGGPPRPEATTLVCTGRLSREKEPEVAIDVARDLTRRGLPFELVMIGDGPERAALERRASGLPVRFLGHVADRAALAVVLRHASVAICPCPHETFGLAALEAMASGVPVVVPAAGALPELVRGGGDGLPGVVAAGGPLAMADAVVALLGADRARHRVAARRRAERYTWPAAATSMETILAGAALSTVAV